VASRRRTADRTSSSAHPCCFTDRRCFPRSVSSASPSLVFPARARTSLELALLVERPGSGDAGRQHATVLNDEQSTYFLQLNMRKRGVPRPLLSSTGLPCRSIENDLSNAADFVCAPIAPIFQHNKVCSFLAARALLTLSKRWVRCQIKVCTDALEPCLSLRTRTRKVCSNAVYEEIARHVDIGDRSVNDATHKGRPAQFPWSIYPWNSPGFHAVARLASQSLIRFH
jgi:hypothetical protein